MMAGLGWEQALFGGLLVLIFLAQASSLLGLLRRGAASDAGSAWALVASWYGVLVVSALEAWRWPALLPDPRWLPYLGAATFMAGLVLRTVAVSTLDKHFSPLVELQAEHALVTHGVYAHVRHPAYLGSWLWTLAVPLMLGSGLGLAAAFAIYAPALRYRIGVEERMLAAHFGPAWAAYRSRVPALWPRWRPARAAEQDAAGM